MKNNLYLKLFVGMGIPFGIWIGIIDSTHGGIRSGLITGLIQGLLFGGIMSLILGVKHSRAVKRISSGNPKNDMGVHHIRNIELQIPYDEAFDLCIESLAEIKKSKVKAQDSPGGSINAKAGMNWKTWGDVITFEINKKDENVIQIKISSRPSVRTTLVDYGKNLENVNKIIDYLNPHREISA